MMLTSGYTGWRSSAFWFGVIGAIGLLWQVPSPAAGWLRAIAAIYLIGAVLILAVETTHRIWKS